MEGFLSLGLSTGLCQNPAGMTCVQQQQKKKQSVNSPSQVLLSATLKTNCSHQLFPTQFDIRCSYFWAGDGLPWKPSSFLWLINQTPNFHPQPAWPHQALPCSQVFLRGAESVEKVMISSPKKFSNEIQWGTENYFSPQTMWQSEIIFYIFFYSKLYYRVSFLFLRKIHAKYSGA